MCCGIHEIDSESIIKIHLHRTEVSIPYSATSDKPWYLLHWLFFCEKSRMWQRVHSPEKVLLMFVWNIVHSTVLVLEWGASVAAFCWQCLVKIWTRTVSVTLTHFTVVFILYTDGNQSRLQLESWNVMYGKWYYQLC